MSIHNDVAPGFRIRKRKTASVLCFIIAFSMIFINMSVGCDTQGPYYVAVVIAFIAFLLGVFSGESRNDR